jgi:hypothetical protein
MTQVSEALDANLALVNSYFGANAYVCNGPYNQNSAIQWLNLMDNLGIGVIAFKLPYDINQCTMLTSSALTTGKWAGMDFTAWGLLINNWGQGIPLK